MLLTIVRTMKCTGRPGRQSEARPAATTRQHGDRPKAEPLLSRDSATRRNPKPEIRIYPSAIDRSRIRFAIIGLSMLCLGLSFADEPSIRGATAARSEGHPIATTRSAADSGPTVQRPSGRERGGTADDVRRGNFASERSRSRSEKPSAESHLVPQARRTSQGIESRTAQSQAIAPNATGLSQPGPGKLSGTTRNEPKNANQPRLPTVSSLLRSSSPLPVNGFHLSSVGGPTRPVANSSAVINGTGFKHRP